MSQDRCPTCDRPYKKQRSKNQNGYLHGVLLKTIGDALGYTIVETKGILKWIIKEEYGIEMPHTSEASTDELEIWMSRAREWASMEDNGKPSIYVPLPNEVDNANTN